jgi:hypothetical protein
LFPQEADGIIWYQSVILAPREIDEISIVLGDTESEASVTSANTQKVSHLAFGDIYLALNSSNTEVKADLSIKTVDKDKSRLA